LLAVYAGYFLRGAIVATVRLRGGRIQTEELSGPRAERQPPSLLSMLSDARRQLHVLRGIAKPPGGREALRLYRQRIAQIERRLAYARAHPGLLPAE
jgi:hypothetical protein